MSESSGQSSGLMRWLPTMLGGLVAIAAVMAYELDFIARDPGPNDCSEQPRTDESGSEPGSGAWARAGSGARPHPARATESQALDDRIAALEAQNQILAERTVTGELSYHGHSQAELEAMARHCDVRTDYPVALGDQEVEDLGLDPAEREAWDRAIQAFAAQERENYVAILRELAPETPNLDTLSLADVRRALTRKIRSARTPADESLQRVVAEERAGMREPPADFESLSAYNRYNRLRYDAGERFAELLGDELGDERALELRAALGGWPGARTRQWGCPE